MSDGSRILPDGIAIAKQFGLTIPDSLSHEDTNTFTALFITRLLCQREKINQNLLNDYLPEDVYQKWQRVLTVLEDGNRTLVQVKTDLTSLIQALGMP